MRPSSWDNFTVCRWLPWSLLFLTGWKHWLTASLFLPEQRSCRIRWIALLSLLLWKDRIHLIQGQFPSRKAMSVKGNPFATQSPRMVLRLVGVTYCFVQNPLASSSISFKLTVLPELSPCLLSCCFYCKRLQHFEAFLQFVEMQTVVGVYIYHSIFIEWDRTWTTKVSPADSI